MPVLHRPFEPARKNVRIYEWKTRIHFLISTLLWLPTMYVVSPRQDPYPQKESYEWGGFVTYIEYGEDKLATRSVQEYENGYVTRYDRIHWEDQFGSLPDFRFGKEWVKNWGEPKYISEAEFEKKWRSAELSEPFKLRSPAPEKPCIWIDLFKSGKWDGQP